MAHPAPAEGGDVNGDASAGHFTWRALAAAPLTAIALVVAAVVACDSAGISFRDPDNVAAGYVVMVGAGVALLVGVDVWLRAARLHRTRRPTREEMGAVRRERWTARRAVAVGVALVSFYATYLAYRNLKALVPFLRPGDLFDRELADVDRGLFLGHDPASVLHDVLGTGIAAHVLSTTYAAFIVFLPLSLALALVFSRRLQLSLFYAAALSINWVLGAATYFVLPALGPVYAFPAWFSDLPHTEATRLQQMLLDDRVGFLADPATGTPQAIAAFASLHVAMSFTALAASTLLRLDRRLRIALWAWLVFTLLATVYLGWHYVVDDLAGLGIGALSLVLARLLTGFDPRSAAGPPAVEVRTTREERVGALSAS
jgi:membrane-associated phospholipid phosphatase